MKKRIHFSKRKSFLMSIGNVIEQKFAPTMLNEQENSNLSDSNNLNVEDVHMRIQSLLMSLVYLGSLIAKCWHKGIPLLLKLLVPLKFCHRHCKKRCQLCCFRISRKRDTFWKGTKMLFFCKDLVTTKKLEPLMKLEHFQHMFLQEYDSFLTLIKLVYQFFSFRIPHLLRFFFLSSPYTGKRNRVIYFFVCHELLFYTVYYSKTKPIIVKPQRQHVYFLILYSSLHGFVYVSFGKNLYCYVQSLARLLLRSSCFCFVLFCFVWLPLLLRYFCFLNWFLLGLC